MSKPEIPLPPKVTLEELLHWKRSERPPAEFWVKFDAELRQKQLAALVKKPRWWQLRGTLALPRYRSVFSALAVVSCSAIVYHQFYSANDHSGAGSSKINVASVSNHDTPAPIATKPTLIAALPIPQTNGVSEVQEDAAANAAVLQKDSPARSSLEPGQLVAMLPWGGADATAVGSSANLPETSSSGTSIAANFALVAQDDQERFNTMTLARSPSRHEVRGSGADSLPTASAAFEDSRKVRLAAYLQTSADAFDPEPTPPEHVRARTTRYLADGAWERGVSRVSAEGSRLSLKF